MRTDFCVIKKFVEIVFSENLNFIGIIKLFVAAFKRQTS